MNSKRVFFNFILVAGILGTQVLETACHRDEPDNGDSKTEIGDINTLSTDHSASSSLFNTNWVQTENYCKNEYYPNGKYYNVDDRILSFSSSRYNSAPYTNYYKLLADGELIGVWSILENGNLYMNYYISEVDAMEIGRNRAMHFTTYGLGRNTSFDEVHNDYSIITSNKITIISENSTTGDLNRCVFIKASESGSSSSSYEKPDIALVDYTLGLTAITLRYRIYNQDKAKVSSAKIYYGKSSPSTPIDATITGSEIYLRLGGLTKNTPYYFKCEAKGLGGTTISETSRLSTIN